MSPEPVKAIGVYVTSKSGQRYRVHVEIRIEDMANWLAARAVSNRTKQARTAFAKAKARPA